MHLSSLPSPYGIGTMGKCAREFVDFLKKAGQKYWQILPVCPTSYGDSPYQSFSTFAGNPYFIDLDELRSEGLLELDDYCNINWGGDDTTVDYEVIYNHRFRVLKYAFAKFDKTNKEYIEFCDENAEWLNDYATFMAVKEVNGNVSWMEWKEPLKLRNPEAMYIVDVLYGEEIEFWKFLQFKFFAQWGALRKYANDNGVEIIGDLPIYVALDSADVWCNPKMFQLDDKLVPTKVAGCPPDGFSATGQLWGNPLYRWDVLADDDYTWWVKRIGFACEIYNILRLDHFRGFESYYAIPFEDEDACNGKWEKGPGIDLFKAIEKQIGTPNIIAEDLGFLTPPVKKMLSLSGFPGMKVMQLGFDSRDSECFEYLPHNYIPECVAYVGTHDNDTIQGWFSKASEEDVAYAKNYLNLSDDLKDCHWSVMKALWATVAGVTIVQAQDLLGLGSESRMNTPSVLGGNWAFRVPTGALDDKLAEKLSAYMKMYQRTK